MDVFFALSYFLLMVGWAHCEPQQTPRISLQQRISDQAQLFVPAQFREYVFKSKLPVFVKDIEHPWLQDKHNLAWLERRPEPIRDLCDMVGEKDAESGNCTIPSDIFDRLVIDNNKWSITNRKDSVDRSPWINMRNRVTEMSQCPAALQQVKYLYIDTYTGGGSGDDPGVELAEQLAETLSSMPNLEHIRWGIPVESNTFFEEAFRRRKLHLPSIKRLALTPGAHYLVPSCPNIEQLEIVNWPFWDNETAQKRLFDATPALKNLTAITLMDANNYGEWSPEFVREVLNAFPHLTNLTMLGEIGTPWRYDGELRRYNEEFKTYFSQGDTENLTALQRTREDRIYGPLLSILSALNESTTLKSLTLPRSSQLSVGFDGGPWCGNAYMGPDGYLTHRSVTKEHIEAVEKASVMAWDALPHLDNIVIGDEYPSSVERDANGKVINVIYPWTGRVHEYLEKRHPNPKIGS